MILSLEIVDSLYCKWQEWVCNTSAFIVWSYSLQGNNQQKCTFVPGTSFPNLILSPPSTISNGSVLISEGVNTSLAISVDENLFLFVATANSVEKVSVTILYHQYIGYSSSLSISSLLVVAAPLYSTPWQYLLLLLLSAGHQQQIMCMLQ